MNIESWAWLIVPLGATRAVQIGLHDRILAKPRAWALKKLNPEDRAMSDPKRPYLSYLLECPWCLSVWIGLAIVLGLVNEATTGFTLWVLLVFAISLSAVVIDRLIDVYASDEAAAERAGDRDAPPPPPPPPPAIATAFDAYESGGRVPGLPADES